MVQLLGLAAVAILVWFGFRALKREAARVTERVRRQQREMNNRADGTLEVDPKTGEYRVRKD